MIRPIILAAAAALIGGLTLSGCVAPRDNDTGFRDVRAMLAERGVAQHVQWNTSSDADASAAGAVRGLLERGELSADDAVQVALLNNRRLQATYEDLGVAQADLVQAGLLRNPVFDAEFKFGEGGGGTTVEMAVVQEFLDVFQIPLRQRVARQGLDAAKLRVGGAVMDLAGEVRRAFYVHQAAAQTLEMRQSVAEATSLSFELAQRLRDAGNITQLRLARERAMHEQAKLDLAAAEADVLATRERLNGLMGVWGPATQQWNVASRLPDVPETELDVEQVEPQAVERSLALAAARAELDAAAGALGIRRTFAPLGGGDVELGAAAEREPGDEWSVGPAVSVPIPLFDTGAAGVSRAQAELRRARQNYAATAVEVRSAARAARDALVAARGRALHVRSVLLPLKQSITQQTQAEYNAMLVGAFDVLQAKQDEIETDAAYVASLREYWLARTSLEQVMNGRVNAQDAPVRAQDASRSESRSSDGH